MLIQTNKKEVRDELWRRGLLAKMLLRPHQRLIYDKIRQILVSKQPHENSYVIDCSRQYGKSFIMFLIAVEECLRTPKKTIVYVGPLKSQVNEIIEGNTFGVVFRSCPAELIPKHDGSTLAFSNGSRIRLAGTDSKNYLNLRGGAAHLILLDEAGFMSDLETGVLPTVEPMLKTTGGKVIYASTPPEYLDHDYINILREHDEKGLISTFTIEDDKSVTSAELEAIISRCRGRDSTKFRREYLCQRVAETSRQVIPEMNKEMVELTKITHEEYEIYNEFQLYWQKYIVLDTGLKDLSAAIFGHYNSRLGKLIVEAEVHLSGDDYRTDKLAELIKETRDELWPAHHKVRYIADCNNPIVNRDLTVLYELPFEPTSKGTLQEMVQEVRNWIYAGRILFLPEAELVQKSAHYAHWDKSRTGFGHSTTLGHFDHLAALIYLVRNVDWRNDSIPILHNVNPHTHWVYGLEKRTDYSVMFKNKAK